MILLALLVLLLLSPEAQAASGCNYPSSLDSYSNKTTGDYLTVADINSRSCAIEQLEIRLNQVLSGIAGGQTLTGGTAAGQSLFFRSTAHATKGAIYFGSNSVLDEANNALGLGTALPTRKVTVQSSSSAMALFQTDGGAIGPQITLFHNAAVTDVGTILFTAIDNTSTSRNTHVIKGVYLDATSSSQDSELTFCVQNNAAGSCNTTAKLSSLGVWTDSSSGANKDYEGDLQPGEAIQKLKQLNMGVYRAKNTPAGKIKNAERHYSPTSEDFYQVFGFGSDTGIAPKDAAFIAAKAVLELEARVQALEKVAP